uniref:Uncharacterized protein n=1 Tax=Magnetovibrio blakemorei TaxID=28181 RepID=C4RAC8_9PROT|nr:hypothetical protein mv1g00026 [Magnetovibrio blakemorei]
MGQDNGIDFVARLVWVIAKLEQLADLIQGKAQFPRAPHKPRSVHMILIVKTLVARGPVRGGQDADLFVVAHGLHITAAGGGHMADGEILGGIFFGAHAHLAL